MNFKAIQALIERTVGRELASRFNLVAIKDAGDPERFEIDAAGGKVRISGTTASALTSGFHWYIKHVCNCHISWCGTRLKVPDPLPETVQPIRQSTEHRHRYYLNYCTYSYSAPFWDWERWEQEIDWMALNGVNLVLHLTGVEDVWRRTFRRLGYSEKQIADFICGPAFFAWQWMQNLTGWGGPLPERWYTERRKLAFRISERLRELGIEAVVPGYSGMVPRNFGELYPEARVIDQGEWCHFPRPSLILPSDPCFDKVSSFYYDELQALYGKDVRYFSMDPFHEGGSAEGIDLTAYAIQVQQLMRRGHPEAVWVLQAWEGNPKPELLGGLDPEHALVLDLWCESKPLWKKTGAFGGVPWVWCMIQNYGGKNGLFGNLETVARAPLEARSDPSAGQPSGIGMAMEGIGTNPVMYDLLTDSVWRKDPLKLDDWLDGYVKRRYGSAPESVRHAWRLLRRSVYGVKEIQQGAVESIICARPALRLSRVSTWGPDRVNYDSRDVRNACVLLFSAYEECCSSDGYLYDLVDVTRQALDNRAREYLHDLAEAFDSKDKDRFDVAVERFNGLILILARLVRTRKELLLGPWLEAARQWGKTDEEKRLFEFNARTLVTLWGPEAPSQVLRDYAHREWSGLIEDFYQQRWRIYLRTLSDALVNGKNPQPIDWYAWEYRWTLQSQSFPLEPSGSLHEIVDEVIHTILKKPES